jgi:cytoskeletal protein CcmA (bactofilin family)
MFKLIKQEKKIAVSQIVDGEGASETGGFVSASINKLGVLSHKPSVISEGCAIEGGINSDGILLLDGQVNGSVDSEGLTIGRSGRVHGKILCKTLHIKGFFSGDAVCNDLLIDETAVVEASISYKSIKVAHGAVIEGTLTQGAAGNTKKKSVADNSVISKQVN